MGTIDDFWEIEPQPTLRERLKQEVKKLINKPQRLKFTTEIHDKDYEAFRKMQAKSSESKS